MFAMDIEKPEELRAYLISKNLLQPLEPLNMKVLPGGVSNKTVLIERKDDQALVLKQALEKLRVKVDWFSNPERIHREAAGMRALHTYVPENATKFIFEDDDEHVLAMEAVARPHENWKTMLLAGEVQASYVKQFATLLATIHKRSFLEKETVAELFVDRSYFEALRLEPYYLYTATRVPEANVFLNNLVTATRNRLLTLVHGDYSPKNILVHNDKLILLDHEVIHFGDPAFDIGFALTHLLSKAHHLEEYRTRFAEAAIGFWNDYWSGVQALDFAKDLENYAIKHLLACLLARVAGRSPLEYLTIEEQLRQKTVVTLLMQNSPQTMANLIDSFVKGVS